MAGGDKPPRETRESRYTRFWSVHRHLRDLSPSRFASFTVHFLAACLHFLLAAASSGVAPTQMNSLTYLSRQFDVLASPRAPPSTPVSESPPSLSAAGDRQRETRLPRVRTWSTKSFRVPFPASSSPGTWNLKRSLSSPAVASAEEPVQVGLRRPSSLPRQHPRPPSRRPSVSSTEKAIPDTGSVIRRIFVVRLFLLLWHYICAAWAYITRQRRVQTVDEVAVEDGSDEDEKDTEDESKDVKPVLLRQPTFPPAIPPPLSQPPPANISLEPSTTTVGPSLPEIPVPPLPNAETSPAARAIPATHTRTSSRASTPGGATHKTPFHLPKTLVLDLDETLIHSTSRPMMSASGGSGFLGLSIFGRSNKGAGHVVEVMLGGRSTLYHVYKRPFVDYFLRKVSSRTMPVD